MKFDSAEEVRRWLLVLTKLENREMPPEDEKQPSDKERKTIIAGIIRQLHLSGNPVEQLRSAPKYGNYLNHAELFSGEHKGPRLLPSSNLADQPLHRRAKQSL